MYAGTNFSQLYIHSSNYSSILHPILRRDPNDELHPKEVGNSGCIANSLLAAELAILLLAARIWTRVTGRNCNDNPTLAATIYTFKVD